MSMYTVTGKSARAALLLTAVLLGACKDALSDGAVAPVPSVQPTIQLALSRASVNDSVVAVELRVNGVASLDAKAVSLTASVVYDTTRLRYLSEDSPSDGALRAVNAARGRVMIAAANATGFSGEVYAKLRFLARDANAETAMSLQLSELHLADATDMRARVTVLPAVVIK